MNIKQKSFTTAGALLGLVCGLTLIQQNVQAADNEQVANVSDQVEPVATEQAPTSSASASTTVSPATNATPVTEQIPQTNVSVDGTTAVNNDVPITENQATTTTDVNLATDAAANNPATPANNSNATVSATNNDTQPANAGATADSNVITSGVWGTSKWDFVHEGDDYTLHFHAGILGNDSGGYFINGHNYGGIGTKVLNGNFTYSNELTKVIFDPGVVADINLSYLFAYLKNLKIIEGLNNLDTSKVTNMDGMFDGCSGLTSLDVGKFDTSKVTNMDGMFDGCSGLTSLDVGKFDTSKVTNMYGMFGGCSGLTSLDVGKFDTSKVTSMGFMFDGCSKLTSLDLSKFDTSKVTSMSFMFDGDYKLYQLTLGLKTILNKNAYLPAVPAKGTKVSGTNKVITSPYWVAMNGTNTGTKYTSYELMAMPGRSEVTTYEWDTQPAMANRTQRKSVTRVINVHQPDGQVNTELQTVTIQRNIKDNEDGTVTYGDWSKANWTLYAVPEIAGYQASQTAISEQAVTGDTKDQTIDVYYTPIEQTVTIEYLYDGDEVGTQQLTGYVGDVLNINYHTPAGYEVIDQPQTTVTVDASRQQIIQVAVDHQIIPSLETKTLTRTINFHYPDGQVKSQNQVAILKRNIYQDAVTGDKVYGTWHGDTWDAVMVPKVSGYTASQDTVAEQAVTTDTTDQVIDIFYQKA